MASDLIDEAYGYPDDSPKCKSCGLKMMDHLGLLGTCRELVYAKERIEELEKDNLRLEREVAALTKAIDFIGENMSEEDL